MTEWADRWRGALGPLRGALARSSAESVCRELLEIAGVPIGGNAPHAIHVHDPRFYRKVLADALLGLGESYMDRWWDCEQLDEMIARMVRAQLRRRVLGSLRIASGAVWAKLTNMQSAARAFEVGRRHYDIGNDLYEAMLDSRMVYTLDRRTTAPTWSSRNAASNRTASRWCTQSATTNNNR